MYIETFASIFEYFQEYKQVVTKLRDAYFTNTTNVDAIRSKNIALISDLHMTNAVLKTIALHANISKYGTDKNLQKNTFFYR